MIHIEPNEQYAKKILQRIITAYQQDERRPSDKWHVYDLLFPRATVGRRLYPKLAEPTPQDIGFFFLGKAIHEHIQKILGINKAEVRGEHLGVLATMDYLGDEALEIKSSRKWTVPSNPESHYIRQAGYYSVVFKLDEVIILVIYPTAGRTWKGKKASTVEIRSWTLYTPAKVRKQIEYDMVRTRDELTRAIKLRSVKHLPPVPAWTVERFDGKIDDGDYEGAEQEMKAHPFYYAYDEKGWL